MATLSSKQLRILKYLHDHPGWVTRKDMEAATGPKGFSKALGAPTKGLPKKGTLEALGLVVRRDDSQPFAYRISDLGEQALRQHESDWQGEFEDYLESEDAREAFLFLLEAGRRISGYELRPTTHGHIQRAVHYVEIDSATQPFAFIVNRRWLLFYLRHPGRTHPGLTVNQLQKRFESAQGPNKSGEFTIRIHNRADAEEVMKLAFGRAGLREQLGNAQAPLEPHGVHLRADDADDEEARDPFDPQDGDQRAIAERQIRERQGQPRFRNALRQRYGDRCLVTGCEVLDILEAAHIKPYRGDDDNHPENGLLLRADIHTLFDLNLLGIEPDELRVELSRVLEAAPSYRELAGHTLRCAPKRGPSKTALSSRYEQFRIQSQRGNPSP